MPKTNIFPSNDLVNSKKSYTFAGEYQYFAK